MTYYFTSDTDRSIVSFIQESDPSIKSKIFTDEIRPAFTKLIENVMFVYRFHSIDDPETLKSECLTNLYEMIPKYRPEKGTKGFSYFNVITKNWFIQKTRERNRKNRLESELYCGLDNEVARKDSGFSISPHEDKVEEREFWKKFGEQLDEWRPRLEKKSERAVLDAIVVLMQNSDMVTIYNRKAVYLYLRDLTGLTTKQVVVNLKKIKGMYLRWRAKFLSDGENDV